jgi:hypothetical protein
VSIRQVSGWISLAFAVAALCERRSTIMRPDPTAVIDRRYSLEKSALAN